MSHVRRFDHVGITVADLNTVTAFFVGLGLEVEGTRMFVEGEFLDTVIGIPDSRTEIVMLRPPDGSTRLELSSFVRPAHQPGSPAAMANELGLRNVAFEVDDLQAAVDGLAADGYGLVGDIGQYGTSGAWPTCAVRRGSSCPWPSGSADLSSAAPTSPVTPASGYVATVLEDWILDQDSPVDRRRARHRGGLLAAGSGRPVEESLGGPGPEFWQGHQHYVQVPKL